MESFHRQFSETGSGAGFCGETVTLDLRTAASICGELSDSPRPIQLWRGEKKQGYVIKERDHLGVGKSEDLGIMTRYADGGMLSFPP